MQVLAMVLAGGEGTRLWPLTEERAKPAVPFGGRYRIIDFVLSSLVNSGIQHIKVITQYKSDSLLKHLLRTWSRWAGFDGFVDPVPPQMNLSKEWYVGSVDAVFQNLNIIHDEDPELVAVFGGDHVYKMDVRQMIAFHQEKRAACTVAAIPVPVEEAKRFGCIAIDADGRVTGFVEKPKIPPEIPGRPGWALASMGNYLFDRHTLVKEVEADAKNSESRHDFGADLLPSLFKRAPVYVYDFFQNQIRGEDEAARGYWVDIGTIEAYHRASMDLVSVSPVLNLYNHQWPIRSWVAPVPPAKFVFADQQTKRIGIATDSMVCEGCVISGGHIEQSILSHNVRLNSFAHVSQSILFEGVNIGRHCRIRRAIIDKGVTIPEGTTIGYDLDEDRKHWFVSDEGIVVVPKLGHLARARHGSVIDHHRT
ncbi:MAG: glucose-1-phosphate adenylyltransferase [Deltaproteobacteria bacterium]|jgi:glucose-1-phosphate adenylyltransferase|nr:glucose-1-phosphate adenylyltransferase [Deltaproteobacteria bacterium]